METNTTSIKTHTFKVCLIGDGGVGKTAFIKRHLTGEFEKSYIPTLGVEVHPLFWEMANAEGEKVNVKFNVWDCAGQPKLGGLRDGYFIEADAAIVMFDLTNPQSLHAAMSWIDDFNRVASAKKTTKASPIVLCGNKFDVDFRGASRALSAKEFGQVLMKATKYYDVSAKSCYNYEKPLRDIVDYLTGEQLVFREPEPIIPPTVSLNPKLILRGKTIFKKLLFHLMFETNHFQGNTVKSSLHYTSFNEWIKSCTNRLVNYMIDEREFKSDEKRKDREIISRAFKGIILPLFPIAGCLETFQDKERMTRILLKEWELFDDLYDKICE